jgi:hypothetical protein
MYKDRCVAVVSPAGANRELSDTLNSVRKSVDQNTVPVDAALPETTSKPVTPKIEDNWQLKVIRWIGRLLGFGKK